MLGPPKSRRRAAPMAGSLETRGPPGTFSRHLEAKLDLSFVREWVRDCSAARGRPSIAPVTFFKLHLVMFFEGIRSERQLVETASLHLAHRWSLGYARDEPLPDHSRLTPIRQRLGITTFERFCERLVDLCQDVGLVWGQERSFDATKVEADADVDSLVPRFAYAAKHHLTDLFASHVLSAAPHAAGPGGGDSLPVEVVRLRAAPAGAETAYGCARPWRLREERR